MDLNQAIQKHAEWKFKFREALHNHATMDATAISKDNNCELGKWLHGEAKSLCGAHPAHAHCLAAHAEFHKEAGKIALQVSAGKADEVERMMATGAPFSEASKNVGVAIIELKSALGNRAA